MLLAGTFGTLVLAAMPAVAQQRRRPPRAARLRPRRPSWPLTDVRTGEGAMKLAPVAPPPIPAAAEKLPTVPAS